jgi:hydrogenase expression/formation protein HypD
MKTPQTENKEKIVPILSHALSSLLEEAATKSITVMEVCGTHTVAIFRHGLRALLPKSFKLVSGPGCPVCVTDQSEIDAAISIAEREDSIVATYGDMLRVPGSWTSLQECRARGRSVRVVTSVTQALDLAEENPDKNVVFLGVGFETTAPATALALIEAKKRKLDNFLVLCMHKTVPLALEALANSEELSLDGFLLPGHVSVIIGLNPYRFIPEKYGKACAIAGFEPFEIMAGLLEIARQVIKGEPTIKSMYPRAVRPEGNRTAQELLDKVFEPCNAHWRGLGEIPLSGYKIRPEFEIHDASLRLNIEKKPSPLPTGCRCGDVLKGLISPIECPLFGRACTPMKPVGPCMVSSEGSCAAQYKYDRKGQL